MFNQGQFKIRTSLTGTFCTLFLTSIMCICLGLFITTNKSYAANEYINVDSAYEELNRFRASDNVWIWNSDDTTKTYFNSESNVYLDKLCRDASLEATAKVRAKELAEEWGHVRPDGSSCFSAYPNCFVKGENIARNCPSAASATETWKETDRNYANQGHRRNMLSDAFDSVGIACYVYDGVPYWVQCFALLGDAKEEIIVPETTTENDSENVDHTSNYEALAEETLSPELLEDFAIEEFVPTDPETPADRITASDNTEDDIVETSDAEFSEASDVEFSEESDVTVSDDVSEDDVSEIEDTTTADTTIDTPIEYVSDEFSIKNDSNISDTVTDSTVDSSNKLKVYPKQTITDTDNPKSAVSTSTSKYASTPEMEIISAYTDDYETAVKRVAPNTGDNASFLMIIVLFSLMLCAGIAVAMIKVKR